jgi:hypothetical protein
MLIHKSITEDRIMEAVEEDDNLGFCVYCGEDASGVEPDAERYECECCGQCGVYGAEQLLLITVA